MPIRQTVSAAKAALFNQFGFGRVHMDFVLAAPVPILVGGGFMRGVLNTFSLQGIGVVLAGAAAPILASTPWPVASRGIFTPFDLAEEFTVRNLFLANGGTVSGNIDLGIYDEALERVLSTGSTAQAGVSVLQVVNVVRLVLRPGRYWWAVAIDNVTGTVTASNPASTVIQAAGAGFVAASFPLPVRVVGPLTAGLIVPLTGMADNRLLF